MSAFGLIYVCSSALEWSGVGHYSSQTRYKGQGFKLQLLFKSFPGPLLKSGVGPMARHGTFQETISRRDEQMYTPSDPGLEWLGEGSLFKSVSNKRRLSKLPPLFKSFPGPLLKSVHRTLGQIW